MVGECDPSRLFWELGGGGSSSGLALQKLSVMTENSGAGQRGEARGAPKMCDGTRSFTSFTNHSHPEAERHFRGGFNAALPLGPC